MDNSNIYGLYVRINKKTTFIAIHFILPYGGSDDGFFFLGNENSDSELHINDCVFTSSETYVNPLFIFRESTNALLNLTEIVIDGINFTISFKFIIFVYYYKI
jgi:hypothetical protein